MKLNPKRSKPRIGVGCLDGLLEPITKPFLCLRLRWELVKDLT